MTTQSDETFIKLHLTHKDTVNVFISPVSDRLIQVDSMDVETTQNMLEMYRCSKHLFSVNEPATHTDRGEMTSVEHALVKRLERATGLQGLIYRSARRRLAQRPIERLMDAIERSN